MSEKGRLDDLAGRYFDGDISDKERCELIGALKGDRASQKGFIREAMVRQTIHDWAAEQMQVSSHEPREADAARAAGKRPRLKLRRSRARLAWMSIAAGLLVAAGAYAMLGGLGARSREAAVASLGRVSGEVVMRRGGGELRASVGAAVLEGDAIAIGAGGSARIEYPGEATAVEAASLTTLRIWSELGAKRISLDCGRIECSVDRQPAGRPMVLRTPQSEVAVLGTAFGLAAGEGRTRLDVTEGRVSFTRTADGRSIEVATGQYALASGAAGEPLVALARGADDVEETAGPGDSPGAAEPFEPFAERWVHASATSAVIFWQTGSRARDTASAGAGYVEYGETDKCDRKTEVFGMPPVCEDVPEGVRVFQKPSWSQFHRITGLAPGKTYFYRMVYVAPDKKETRSEKLQFATKAPANAVPVPGAIAGPPYILNQAGATYVLTKDITSDGDGIQIQANDVTLDMDGHKVVFAAKGGNDKIVNGVFVGQKNGARILNGVVEQGAADAVKCIGVHVNGCNKSEVAGVSVRYGGKDGQGVASIWAGAETKLHHNLIYDTGTETTSRHQQLNAITVSRGGSGAAVHHNIIWRTRQSGISFGGSEKSAREGKPEGSGFDIYNNMIYQGSCMTNSMGVSVSGGVRDFNIRNNRIYGRGEMPECIFNGAGACQGKVFSNYTYSMSTGKVSKEYNAESSLTAGLRMCWGPHHLDIYDNSFNTVSGKTGDFVGNARCIWAACTDSRQPEWKTSGEISIHDNEITATVDGTGGGYARAISVCGDHQASSKGLSFRKNRVTGNGNLVVLSESYGCGSSDVEFTGNAFVKSGDGPTAFAFLTCGYWDKPTTGTFFADSSFEGGAGYDGVQFSGSAERNFSVGWTLTVRTAPGADISVTDKTGKEVFAGKADKDGAASFPLMQYRQTPGGKEALTPHAVKVTSGSKTSTAQVTMDKAQELKLEL